MCRLKKTISVLIPEDRLVCLGTQHSINQRNTCDTFIMQRVYAPRKPATGIPEGPAPRARRSPSPAAARWGRCLCCPLPRPHAGPTEEEAEGEAMIKRHGGNNVKRHLLPNVSAVPGILIHFVQVRYVSVTVQESYSFTWPSPVDPTPPRDTSGQVSGWAALRHGICCVFSFACSVFHVGSVSQWPVAIAAGPCALTHPPSRRCGFFTQRLVLLLSHPSVSVTLGPDVQ